MQEKIKEIKKEFMAYRNGVVADTLRNAGMECYRIIFGLNLPQISAIAHRLGQDKTLAEALWADTGVRESRLLATYLFPPQEIDETHALALMAGVQTQEEADMLCFRLLRYLPCLDALKGHAQKYMAVALARY